MSEKYRGLSAQDAAQALLKYGLNLLPEKSPPGSLTLALAQLKSPLVYVLLVSGLVTFFLREYSDMIIIALAVFINTVLGYVQEKKANESLAALKRMLHPVADVIRDGVRKSVPVSEIVPGDVVVLQQGDKIPADGVVLEASHLFIAEAILTGESVPVEKSKEDKVFMGTVVTAGHAYFKVEKTGAETQMGSIAQSVQGYDTDTPLKLQLKSFSKFLSILVVALIFVVFVLGVLGGRPLAEIFTTSVALAVSAIPEGLLVALTVILAVGMQRILKKKGLVRNLVSAETLGGVTTICVDKTGTLTEGVLQVVEVKGDKVLLSKQALLSNDRDDPIEISSWEWANKTLTSKDLKGEKIGDYLKKHGRVDSMPFSSQERFSATLHKWNKNKNILYVNGAPDFLLEWCSVSPSNKKQILKEINRLTSQGMRLVGYARRELKPETKKITKKLANTKLEWVGILAFSDPVRKGVKEALSEALKAGIRTVVITGDYPQTALSVLRELGIEVSDKNVVLGEGLKQMDKDKLSSVIQGRQPMLFARTVPDQKLKIVQALKSNGEVVAMTGDGVNDAPALSQADIGIAVFEATDVAKESADLVLLDSSFSTIVTAVEEGRGIFDNIRKVVLYLLSDAFSEIVAVLGAIALGLPLPVTATQILWINLVSDGFPNLALTIDPKRPRAMSEPPRNPQEPLVNHWMMGLIILVSVFSGLSALLLFVYIRTITGNIVLARSVAFATLGINSLAYVFSIRALKKPIWAVSPFNNRWLIAGVVGGLVLQILPFVTYPTQQFFGVESIPLHYWILIAAVTAIMVILIEISKALFRRK
ncbi:HAD family hydrolase [Candidatus Microgenomates bacterium]|nr:MAG: HAD family hydrolase [Candidatus Microgenomates bacterium]